MESTENKQKKKPPQKPSVVNVRWVVTIMAVSFVLSVVMSYISNEALNSAGTILSFVVLFFFIGLGIVFDMIGVAATSGTEKEFHSMAAHKVRGAREAVWMVRNAEKVSSICNDVVGDICGIISGATGALIVTHITAGTDGATKVLVSARRLERASLSLRAARCLRCAAAFCPCCRSSWIIKDKTTVPVGIFS